MSDIIWHDRPVTIDGVECLIGFQPGGVYSLEADGTFQSLEAGDAVPSDNSN